MVYLVLQQQHIHFCDQGCSWWRGAATFPKCHGVSGRFWTPCSAKTQQCHRTTPQPWGFCLLWYPRTFPLELPGKPANLHTPPLMSRDILLSLLSKLPHQPSPKQREVKGSQTSEIPHILDLTPLPSATDQTSRSTVLWQLSIRCNSQLLGAQAWKNILSNPQPKLGGALRAGKQDESCRRKCKGKGLGGRCHISLPCCCSCSFASLQTPPFCSSWKL